MPFLSALYAALTRRLQNFFNYFIPKIRDAWQEVVQNTNGIPFRNVMQDVVSILANVWVFIVFNLLTLLIFTLMPQGKDILLVLIEKLLNKDFIAVLLLPFVIAFWAIVTEFGARYAIYTSDNSGNSLSAQRVNLRKSLQKFISMIFLVFPFLIILISLIIIYFSTNSIDDKHKNIGFGILSIWLFLVFNQLSRYYYKNLYNSGVSTNAFISLPQIEKEYAQKLYGIYNNYVFKLPMNSWFSGNTQTNYKSFEINFFLPNGELINGFPQNSVYINQQSKIVPEEFKFLRSENPYLPNSSHWYTWEYKIPLRFYKKLHKQLFFIAGISTIIFFSLSFFTVSMFQAIGSPALVCLAFACFSGMYVGLMYIDIALLRDKPFTIRLFLIVLLIFSSITNSDHSLRKTSLSFCADNRPELTKHFSNWFTNFKKDKNHQFFVYTKNSDGNTVDTLVYAKDTSAINHYKLSNEIVYTFKHSFYPIIFVCAEGGALRTGAYASLLLSNLQEKIPTFKNHIYAMSGVSGGSLGIGYFNAINYLAQPTDFNKKFLSVELTEAFFSKDYLSPVLGKMLYGDFINLFIPFDWQVHKFRRDNALEDAWNEGYATTLVKGGENYFAKDYQLSFCDSSYKPLICFNTTEVESGLQGFISNVNLQNLTYGKKRDLLFSKIYNGIYYSTAINFSTRFPLVSPAVSIKTGVNKHHYIDGGYVENTGTGTMKEIMELIFSDTVLQKQIKPIVLSITFSDDKNNSYSNINFGNEFNEIIDGIYNTRVGRSNTAQEQLKMFVEDANRFCNKGEYFSLSLDANTNQVPLNWVLSAQSLSNIDSVIKKQFTTPTNNFFEKLKFLNLK